MTLQSFPSIVGLLTNVAWIFKSIGEMFGLHMVPDMIFFGMKERLTNSADKLSLLLTSDHKL